MTQRIFDMENEQDIKDLFGILPNSVMKILQDPNGCEIYSYSAFSVTSGLLNIKWGNKTYVDRPVDKSKWIGCLCWFWDEKSDDKYIGILQKIEPERHTPYIKNNNMAWKNCRPVQKSEIKFVEDMEA